MTLDEAIIHLEEVIKTIECEECKEEHIQLYHWLCELKERREGNDIGGYEQLLKGGLQSAT